MTLWTQIKDNIWFLLMCCLIAATLFFLAKLAQWFLPEKRNISPARRVSIVGICAAIATVLHMIDFPLPFLAPPFYKLDFSELPVMLCGFYLGPTATVVCEALKILLKLLFKGTSTAFVGDFANFTVGCSLVLPAVIIYHAKKTKGSALWGLVAGTLFMTLFGSAFNALYLLPTFAKRFMSAEDIIAAGAAIFPAIDSFWTLALMCVVPLNLLKGTLVSILTMLLYKRVARPLFDK